VIQVSIFTLAGKKNGLGHLVRSTRIYREFVKYKVESNLYIISEPINLYQLKDTSFEFLNPEIELRNNILSVINRTTPTHIIFDFYSDGYDWTKLLKHLKSENFKLIAIDGFIEYSKFFDIVWIPSLFPPKNKFLKAHKNYISGENSLILNEIKSKTNWSPGKDILVMMGGTDVNNFARSLPALLDENFSGYIFHWISGPTSQPPVLTNLENNEWNLHANPRNLEEIIDNSSYALLIFGVSFLEVCQFGKPISVFSPYGFRDIEQLNFISKEKIAVVSETIEEAVDNLKVLINSVDLSKKLASASVKKVHNSSKLLVNKILNT